ncbi:MAG TPA: hypothetical protein VF145_03550 [Chitinophagaceae bacterium]
MREEILKAHNKQHTLEIAESACSSEKAFKALMDCFTSDETVLAQRAAWAVSCAAALRPDLVKPYLSTVAQALERKNVHEAVVRNALKILSQTEIPEQLQGQVMDSCFRFLETPGTAIAVKAHSLTILENLSHTYPEILPELKLLIEMNWDTETAAFRSRAGKILKAMKSVKHP